MLLAVYCIHKFSFSLPTTLPSKITMQLSAHFFCISHLSSDLVLHVAKHSPRSITVKLHLVRVVNILSMDSSSYHLSFPAHVHESRRSRFSGAETGMRVKIRSARPPNRRRVGLAESQAHTGLCKYGTGNLVEPKKRTSSVWFGDPEILSS